MSHIITINNPGRVVFGNGSFDQFVNDFYETNNTRLFVLTIPVLKQLVEKKLESLRNKGIEYKISCDILDEPSFGDFRNVLSQAKHFKADSVVGIGGGSILDTAKLVAALVDKKLDPSELVLNTNKICRGVYLACLPSTAGTGSEVSPNAIFFDEESSSKIGVIHRALVPDGAYIDPILTQKLPPSITAATGIDALTHCIEAYVNKFSHPVTDLWALEGIRLIGKNLRNAYFNGIDLDARSKVALGSVYGGMCLGPVNTAAVHALAYPLGSKYKIAHGVSNALLLPHVMEFNLESATEKYAHVALAMGAEKGASDIETAKSGIEKIRIMISEFELPSKLSELNINEEEIEDMAHSAIKIQRLLKNNVREVKLMNAIDIYLKAF